MIDLWGASAIVAKFLLYLGVLSAAGTVFVALLFRRAPLSGLAMGWAVVGLAAAAVGFALRGAALTGEASGMVDAEMLGLLWSTPVGTALALRLAGLLLLIGGLLLGGVGLWIAGAGGVVALWSFASVGHVPDRDLIWLNALLMLHLLGIALWIGILTPLRRLAVAGEVAQAAALGHRFGQVAAVLVPALILAGGVMGAVLLGSVGALLSTGYGQVLCVKVAVVAGLLALAAWNKLRLVPQLRAGKSEAARQLARSIGAEWAAVLGILLASAVLTSVLTLPG